MSKAEKHINNCHPRIKFRVQTESKGIRLVAFFRYIRLFENSI